ncbi:MerR family transcriptional regulator [Streptomyces sp. NPDC054887]
MDVARQPSQDAGLTTGALALRLGVAPTTLRSWDRRYGLGPADREGGRHRRWKPADVAVLERMCRLTAKGVAPAEAARLARTPDGGESRRPPRPAAVPVPGPRTGGGPSAHDAGPGPAVVTGVRPDRTRPADGPDPADTARVARGLCRAAVRLDSPLLDALLAATVAHRGLVAAWEDVMTPALRAIGRTWAASGDEAAERYVEAEHLLSWHISCALRRPPPQEPAYGRDRADPADGRPVLLACAPGEGHTLALEALAAALGERGTPVRMFGAAVPVGALTEAVRRTGPSGVVLWSQTRPTADRTLPRLLRATAWGIKGARTRPAVLVAGPGWSRTRPTEGVHRPKGLGHALELIESVRGG